MRIIPTLFALTLLLLATGCSQTRLLTKHDYEKSQSYFIQGNANDALLDRPRRAEQGTFINAMERGYLNLIQGRPSIKALRHQAKILENRVRYHISREAKTFFYLQTPEDYYASEHEVIWLHLLLSWGYSLEKDYENAAIEARIAGSLLSLPWSPEGHFDDPTLRLFLASLWTMCGEWEEAQVDLRAAWALDNSLTWARELAQLERPPANLFIVLGGPGPEPIWSPEFTINPLRSERQVSFKLRGKKSALSITDKSGISIPTHISPDASHWYARHVARESELHEMMLDSAYGGNAAVSGVVATAKIAVSTSFGIAVGLGGSALGAAVMYLGLEGKSEDLFGAGAAIVGYSLLKGLVISKEGYEESSKELNQQLDPSESYRFVRYLPEYLWMGWSQQAISYPLKLRTPYSQTGIMQPTIINNNSLISIAYLPDTGERFLGY